MSNTPKFSTHTLCNYLFFSFALYFFLSCQPSKDQQQPIPITKIAFGSCASQDKPQPILDVAVSHQPDYFIYLGDNIYGDSHEPDTLRMKYARLAEKPEFLRLISKTRVLATWDDHDYGWNDSGRHYPEKKISKSIFLDFWNEPPESVRRHRDGIYASYNEEVHGHKLQIILLDNRTFRDNLRKYDPSVKLEKSYFYDLDYLPHATSDSTLLGEQQWQWLEEQLRQPADIRIIGSGTQFGIEFNGYEAWANFPHEQQRMLDLIKKTKANGVFFITGDVHYGEISMLKQEGLYPIYDFTSSGITSTWDFATPNENRIEGPVMDNHIGLITIHWEEDPRIVMEIFDVHDNQRVEYEVMLSKISF
jgi:alkaline phosphatase D